MNYSDLAKRCLNEATNLLNEGARWNKEMSKAYGEESSIQRGRKLSKEIAKTLDEKDSMKKAIGLRKILESNRDIDNSETTKHFNRNALDKISEDNEEKVSNVHRFINIKEKHPNLGKREAENYYRRKKRISQNECTELAVLLTEAALLLSE